MKNHSPGPWSVSFYSGEPCTAPPGRRKDEWHIDPAKNDNSNGASIIASVHGPNMEANAKLVAAAPDLLAALSDMLWPVSGMSTAELARLSEKEQTRIKNARAAITKALKG